MQAHLLDNDDERSTNDAIAEAGRAGISIPQNVPSSALMGGTNKRLGGRKITKIIQQDDWNDDLELPEPGTPGLSAASALNIGSRNESEDKRLDGQAPNLGSFNFENILKKRQQTLPPEHEPERREEQWPEEKQRAEKQSGKTLSLKHATFEDDFLSELDIPDGDVLNFNKLGLNHNIKIKVSRNNIPNPSDGSELDGPRDPPASAQVETIDTKEPALKAVKGMFYNSQAMRWEGNEEDLSLFDAPSNSPSVVSTSPNIFREKENAASRPALVDDPKNLTDLDSYLLNLDLQSAEMPMAQTKQKFLQKRLYGDSEVERAGMGDNELDSKPPLPWSRQRRSTSSSEISQTSSLASISDSIFSLATASSMSSVTSTHGAGDRLIALLREDPILQQLYQEALATIAAERLERNLRRLLKQFAVDLRKEAENPQQRSTAHFVRSRAWNSAHVICKSLGQNEPKPTTKPLVVHVPLEAEVVNDLSDSSSDSDSQDEPPDLSELELFVVNSRAFETLRLNLRLFIHPEGPAASVSQPSITATAVESRTLESRSGGSRIYLALFISMLFGILIGIHLGTYFSASASLTLPRLFRTAGLALLRDSSPFTAAQKGYHYLANFGTGLAFSGILAFLSAASIAAMLKKLVSWKIGKSIYSRDTANTGGQQSRDRVLEGLLHDPFMKMWSTLHCFVISLC
jgi:hypothetical protein